MSKNTFKLEFDDDKAIVFCSTKQNKKNTIDFWEEETNAKVIKCTKVYRYLGRYWEKKIISDMYNKYEGWKSVIFELTDTEEKGELIEDVNYKNGKFNKVRDDIHIAIEKVSYDPQSKQNFNQLFVAFKDFDNWQGRFPEWNYNYLN